VLIFLGLFGLISGTIAGLWFLLLGGFLYFIAGASYEQVLIKDVLSQVTVTEIMKKLEAKFVLRPEMNVAELVQKYANSENNAFLIQGKSFTGLLDLQRIDTLTLRAQQLLKLKQLALPLSLIKTVQSDDNGYTAFKKLAEQNLELLPVMKKKKIVGIITRRALMHRLIWGLKYGVVLGRKKK
jgi:predicted transcriptional regulator